MIDNIDTILVKQAVVDAETTVTVPRSESVRGNAWQSAQSAAWTTQGRPD